MFGSAAGRKLCRIPGERGNLLISRKGFRSAGVVPVLRIGIRREDKNEWERRVPLVPDNVKALVAQGVPVFVQPSKIRVFKDDEFSAAGATVQEDLSGCDLVLGIKEFPEKSFREGQSCMFFAHVTKGQKHNMPMLRKMMELHCTLLDYEKVADEEGRRLIFFGNFAGLAGMLETLTRWASGSRPRAPARPSWASSVR
jgi:alpha-aminoadipic semialdehyde synthase